MVKTDEFFEQLARNVITLDDSLYRTCQSKSSPEQFNRTNGIVRATPVDGTAKLQRRDCEAPVLLGGKRYYML